MLPASPSSKGTYKWKEQCFWKAGHISLSYRGWRQHPTWFEPMCQSRDVIPSTSLLGLVPSPFATFICISRIFERKEGENLFLPSNFFICFKQARNLCPIPQFTQSHITWLWCCPTAAFWACVSCRHAVAIPNQQLQWVKSLIHIDNLTKPPVMYIQWYARKYSFAGRIYSMTLLSAVSKAGRDVRDARRKPAQPLHSLGWLRWQSTANAALGIGSPGCFQPWRVERFPHCTLIPFRWVLFCSCKTPQKKNPNWSQERKKNGGAAGFEWGSFITWCLFQPLLFGNNPTRKSPPFQLILSAAVTELLIAREVTSTCVSRCDLEAPTVYFNVNIFFVEKQKGLEKGRLWEYSGWDKESEAEKNTPITSAHTLICQMKPVLPAVAQRQNTTGLLMSRWPLVMSPGKWVPGRERKRAVLVNASSIYLCSSSIN